MPSTKVAFPDQLKPICRCRRSQSSMASVHDWSFSGEAWVCQNQRDAGDRGRFVRVSGIVRAECERSARVLAARMAREQAVRVGEVYSIRIDRVE